MKRTSLVALAAILALPVAGGLRAQEPGDHPRPPMESSAGPRQHAGQHMQPGMRPGMRRGRQGGMAAGLLAHRQELRLTDRQVARLTDIQKKYRERNRDAMTRMRASRSDTDRKAAREEREARRQEFLKSHPEVRQAMDQLRDNRKHEREDVESVLTAEQKAQLKERMSEAGREGRGFRRDSAAAGRDSR